MKNFLKNKIIDDDKYLCERYWCNASCQETNEDCELITECDCCKERCYYDDDYQCECNVCPATYENFWNEFYWLKYIFICSFTKRIKDSNKREIEYSKHLSKWLNEKYELYKENDCEFDKFITHLKENQQSLFTNYDSKTFNQYKIGSIND